MCSAVCAWICEFVRFSCNSILESCFVSFFSLRLLCFKLYPILCFILSCYFLCTLLFIGSCHFNLWFWFVCHFQQHFAHSFEKKFDHHSKEIACVSKYARIALSTEYSLAYEAKSKSGIDGKFSHRFSFILCAYRDEEEKKLLFSMKPHWKNQLINRPNENLSNLPIPLMVCNTSLCVVCVCVYLWCILTRC